MHTWSAVFVYVSTLPTRFQFVHFVVLRLVVRWENSPICDTCKHKKKFKSHIQKYTRLEFINQPIKQKSPEFL